MKTGRIGRLSVILSLVRQLDRADRQGDFPVNPATLSYWPADTAVPVLETTVGSVLRDAAVVAPDRTAIVAWTLAPGQRQFWTYAALLRDAERTARALLARFEPGQHIAVYAPNSAEWLLLELGAGLAGMVLVTVNPASRARELDYILRQSRLRQSPEICIARALGTRRVPVD